MTGWRRGRSMGTGMPGTLFVVELGSGLLLATGCARPHPAKMSASRPVAIGDEQVGRASWYGHPYHGRRTASGEVYDMNDMTAAHRTLAFGTWVLVESQVNGRTAEVRITDRGPFVDDRILDLSAAAARVLGAIGPGTIPIRLRVIRLPGARPATSGAWTPVANFAVQIAAFSAAHRANALRDELSRQGVESAYVQAATIAGAVFYRVRVGPYAKRAAAEAQALQLADAGYAVLVVGE